MDKKDSFCAAGRLDGDAAHTGGPAYGRDIRHREGWKTVDGGFDYNGRRWKRLSERVKRRDGYRCVWCRRYGRNVAAAVVHHIKPAGEYPELAYRADNLVSLCQACHNKAHPEKARAAAAGRRMR